MSTANNKLDGKAFVGELSKCETPKDIFALLDRTMSRDVLKDRMSNIDKLNEKNVDLILTFHAANAKVRASHKGVKISHQDCVNMAVNQYNNITSRGYKGFKIELNKYQATKSKNQSIEMAVDSQELFKRIAQRKQQTA